MHKSGARSAGALDGLPFHAGSPDAKEYYSLQLGADSQSGTESE